MITATTSGSWDRSMAWLARIASGEMYNSLRSYADAGTRALAGATPKDRGVAAAAWSADVKITSGYAEIVWRNSDIENGFPVVISLQYGHGTGTGGYVSGRDFINPAIKPIFDQIENAVWREVTRG